MARAALTSTIAATALVLTGLTPTLVSTPSAATASDSGSTVNRQITDSEINESSGLALGNRHERVLYTHNDSGGGPVVYAVGPAGRTRAELRLAGASARDWEDISTGPRNTLWLGDIGDNARARTTISVYRIKEPRRLRDRSLSWTRFDFRYPDGAHDAEALLVRPRSGRVFIVSKEDNGALYRAPRELSTTKVNQLRKVRAGLPIRVTAGAFAARGRSFAVRNHGRAWIYSRLRDRRPRVVSLPDMPQGESLEFGNGGGRLLAGSERRDSLVWSVPLD